MKNAIRKYKTPFLALVGTIALGLAVGGYILSNQRFYLPNWVPVIGTDFVDYKAEFSTAQAVTPGQGQTINIAGVPVGEIASVKLVDGRAVVGMKIDKATILPEIQVDLWAMTSAINLVMKGYARVGS